MSTPKTKELKKPRPLTAIRAISLIDATLARLPNDNARRRVLAFLDVPREGAQMLVPGAQVAAPAEEVL